MSLKDRFDDEELGFVELAGKAAGSLVKGIGKAFKKKKKKKPAAKVIQMDPTNIVGNLPATPQKAALSAIVKGAAKAKAKKGKAAPRDVVAEIVSQVPPLVRQQVLDALKAAKDSAASQAQTMGAITEQVDDALKPQITAMLAALQAQGISKQATYEHDELVKRADFERKTVDGLAGVLARLDGLEKTFDLKLRNPKIAIVTQRMPVFGPKNVLEG